MDPKCVLALNFANTFKIYKIYKIKTLKIKSHYMVKTSLWLQSLKSQHLQYSL